MLILTTNNLKIQKLFSVINVRHTALFHYCLPVLYTVYCVLYGEKKISQLITKHNPYPPYQILGQYSA